ncbi:MAG: NifU family protein [Candidatus Omnitrophica bacterium]|nr:NifU family protein [Candidatus Omnitrophota bacterium]
MEYAISVQPTPNPNALKFVLNVPVKSKDSAVYRQYAECGENKIAEALLRLDNVTEVYFSSNFITVTQNGGGDWDAIEERVRKVILELMKDHDPDFATTASQQSARPAATGELGKIEAILDATIRPALQRDGGDLTVVGLDGKVLTISYQGACGCCPHATMGTLFAIQNILRDQYDPEITVEMS